ncbi:MAG: hypothetical protein WC766_05465 [Patescibacteria group bacterium]|jgi:hypothetical protein
MKKFLIPFLILVIVLFGVQMGFALTAQQHTPRDKQLMVDGSMDASGTGSYTATQSGSATASLAKVAGGVGGNFLRVTNSGAGAGNIWAIQNLGLTTNRKYKLSGYARGDGVHAPRAHLWPTATWIGTNSSNWQHFEVVGRAGGSYIYLGAYTVAAGGKVEFDDIFVTEYVGYAQNGEKQVVADGNMEDAQTLGAETLNDWDMEAADTSAWTERAGYGAMTKEAGNPSGSGTQVLHIAPSQAYYYVSQTGISSVNTYHVTGWARGDGTRVPYIGTTSSGSRNWVGTSSTGWQQIDTFITGQNNIAFNASAAATGWVEFDDISVKQVTAGTASWAVGNSAGLGKIASSLNGGGNQALRISCNLTATPMAIQNSILTVGKRYRVTGWARGDGAFTPLISLGSTTPFIGSTSANWQKVDVIATVAVSPNLALKSNANVSGGHADFDNITITEYKGAVGVTDKQLLVDGNMEASGNVAWGLYTAATFSKSTDAKSGKQSFKITATGAGAAKGLTNVLTAGKVFKITGWAKSDGIRIPTIESQTTGSLWTGTTAATWQYINIVTPRIVAGTFAARLLLGTNSTGSAGQYILFDDIMVTQMP